ncbi:MAG: cell wall hydrolase [Novosphingobium sp.]
MSKRLRFASGLAVAAMFVTTLASAEGAGASAEPFPAAQPYAPSSAPVVTAVTEPSAPPTAAEVEAPDAVEARSLTQLVSSTPTPQDLSSELDCLAGAIYFEAKGETLAGQLAVGRVIVARAKSGRFPARYCGVVYQRSQFSFVRGRSMPAINKAGRAWTEAARIARIAHEGSWKSPVEGALYFHAARVSPGWRLTRLARVDNHVFYR